MSRVVSESVGLALTKDSRVDVEAGIIRGAKVLGSQSRNKRTYPQALLAQRYGVYEGAQVYCDHDYSQLRTGKARPLAQWGGVLRGVTCKADGIYGDVHCLRETTAGKIILEAASRCPDKFGLSAMHLIESKKTADGEVVTAILECWSVDAVTRPATTKTLFEQEETPMADDPLDMGAPPPAGGAAAGSIEDAFMALQNAIMADGELEDDERLRILKDVMRLKSKVLGGPEEEPAEGGEEEPAEESHRRPIGRHARHDKELSEIKSSLRALTIRQMAGESLHLDAPTMQTLLGLQDDAAVAAYLDGLRRQQRRRYTSGPARSTGRYVAGESQGSRAPAVPRLTAGADREAVKRFYRGG